jgi:hypothetical protein
VLGTVKGLFPKQYVVPTVTSEAAVQGLQNGLCNVLAGGIAEVLESTIREVGQYQGEYAIAPRVFSKDPLALVTRQDDPQWAAFVYWVLSAISYAEERNITSASSTEMPIVNLFGQPYEQMLRHVIAAVGSYKEVYDRNLESMFPRSGLNLQNRNSLGPQHYPLPGFGA